MLALRGVRGRYLALEKSVRQTAESILAGAEGLTLVASTVDVRLLGDTAAEVHVRIRNSTDESVPAGLARAVVGAIQERTGCRSEVTVEMIPSQTYSSF